MSGDHNLGNVASEGFDQLRNENRALQEENRILKERISFLEGHSTLSEGLRGERLVQSIIGGMLTTHTESYDLALETGQLIEIKMAKLNLAVKGFTTKRWAWGKIFGVHGAKRFDFAILVGHVDERFREQYADLPLCHIQSKPNGADRSAWATANDLSGICINLGFNDGSVRCRKSRWCAV